MGRDKATLPYRDATLVEHVVNQLRPLVDRLVVAASPAQELPHFADGVKVVRDSAADPGGPLRGLAAAWAVLDAADLTIVWSTDCPRIEPRLIEHLFGAIGDREAAVVRSQGRVQGLSAVYRVQPARDAVRRLLAEGSTAAHRLAERLDTVWIDDDALRLVDPGGTLHVNVNTPSDYAELEAESRAVPLLSREVLEWHERERRLTAYEIHDGLVQDVTGALLRVEALLARASGAETTPALAEIGSLLRKAIDEGRRLIAGLRPPILDESGLLPALEYLIAGEFRVAGLEVTLAHDEPLARGSDLAETSAYRIVHEALANAARHSGAARVEVEVGREGPWLRLEVRDGGRGFDPGAVGALRFGLKSIRDRARILGGQAEIVSRRGQGTTVRVWLPWEA